MRKLDYHDPKLMEIIQMLTELQYTFRAEADGIDIQVPSKPEYRKLQHELHKIFHTYQKPPLSQQFDHSSNTLTLFDPRQR